MVFYRPYFIFFSYTMKKYIVELLGAFFLVLVIALTGDPIAIGVVLMVMVYAGGHISGAHYNPAVTFGLWLRGKIWWWEATNYVIAQLVGAFLAAAVARWLTGFALVPTLGEGVIIYQGLVVEILFTFLLVSTVLNTAATKATSGNSYFGLAIGFALMVGAFAGWWISGGAFNPAVGVAPLLYDMIANGGTHSHIWLYIVGPLLGALLAAYVYGYTNTEQ